MIVDRLIVDRRSSCMHATRVVRVCFVVRVLVSVSKNDTAAAGTSAQLISRCSVYHSVVYTGASYSSSSSSSSSKQCTTHQLCTVGVVCTIVRRVNCCWWCGGAVTDTHHGHGTRTTRTCLLYTSPSPRDLSTSRMPSSA